MLRQAADEVRKGIQREDEMTAWKDISPGAPSVTSQMYSLFAACAGPASPNAGNNFSEILPPVPLSGAKSALPGLRDGGHASGNTPEGQDDEDDEEKISQTRIAT